MPNIIYLDNASTTKLDPNVKEVFSNALDKHYANPSSIHKLGQEDSYLLNKTKDEILHLLKCNDHQVIFTSGATESNNLAIKGVCLKYQNRGKHIITSIYEHPSVLEAFKQLEETFGFEVTYLPVNKNGVVEIETLKSSLRKDTILVSVMAVNNEIGSINNIHEISLLLKNYPTTVFHVDVTQGIGKIKIPYADIDMFSFSGHKIHGLNSSGALIKRHKIELLPLLSGGGQEYGIRSGTNDVALAVSLAKALRLEIEKIDENYAKVKVFAEFLLKYLSENKDLYELNSDENPYIVNFSLLNKKASVLVEALSSNGVMVSSTSACHAKEEPISYVVKALGKSDQLAHNTVRVSFSHTNTLDDVRGSVTTLDRLIKELK